ncbi:hypothetical protein BR93DRAFT_957367 [Coniochaeta sp. PMI_546]|nr:hypothetical protein BR93DRAFT_957367 [Coniochaeta sp. PMI_546]
MPVMGQRCLQNAQPVVGPWVPQNPNLSKPLQNKKVVAVSPGWNHNLILRSFVLSSTATTFNYSPAFVFHIHRSSSLRFCWQRGGAASYYNAHQKHGFCAQISRAVLEYREFDARRYILCAKDSILPTKIGVVNHDSETTRQRSRVSRDSTFVRHQGQEEASQPSLEEGVGVDSGVKPGISLLAVYHSTGTVYNPSSQAYHETLIDNCYPEKNRTVTSPEPQENLPKMETPVLPEKSALRASRMFNMDSKFQGSIQSTELSQATPHDVYLSSEEDASSSADEFDFSDYDYDSESEDPQSPRRTSHEDTARVVSVVFMGKPSLIDLPTSRRSVSPNSIEARRRASTVSSVSPSLHRSVTESAASSLHHQSPRKSSLVSSLLSRKKPPFLQIDPYANGSTYSLDAAPKQEEEHNVAPKTPRTPTAMLKNMSRTLSLVRKRSRPLLNTNIPMATALEHPEDDYAETPASAPALPPATQTEPLGGIRMSSLPSPRVTYQDIIKAAKKNSMMAPLQPSPVSESYAEQSPVSSTATTTTPTTRRGILSGLAARRRSVKLTGRVI